MSIANITHKEAKEHELLLKLWMRDNLKEASVDYHTRTTDHATKDHPGFTIEGILEKTIEQFPDLSYNRQRTIAHFAETEIMHALGWKPDSPSDPM